MYIQNLPRDCLVELKCSYMVQLADSGSYAEVMEVDYDEPSQGDFADADDLIPDDVIFEHYDEINFVKDDFFCMLETSYEEWDKIESEVVV